MSEWDDQRGATARFDEDAICEGCGRAGAFDFGVRRLCQECYSGCGSCCPEFGQDDLWQFEKDPCSW